MLEFAKGIDGNDYYVYDTCNYGTGVIKYKRRV